MTTPATADDAQDDADLAAQVEQLERELAELQASNARERAREEKELEREVAGQRAAISAITTEQRDEAFTLPDSVREVAQPWMEAAEREYASLARVITDPVTLAQRWEKYVKAELARIAHYRAALDRTEQYRERLLTRAIPKPPTSTDERRREDRDTWLRASESERVTLFARGTPEFLHNVQDRLDATQAEMFTQRFGQPVLSAEDRVRHERAESHTRLSRMFLDRAETRLLKDLSPDALRRIGVQHGPTGAEMSPAARVEYFKQHGSFAKLAW